MRNGSDSWVMVPPSASTSPGHGGDLVGLRIREIDHREFHARAVFRVVLGFALLEAHVAGDGEQIGGEAAGEHDDEAEVDELDAEFAPGPTEAADVRGDQIHQQHRADQVAAGKHRDAEAAGGRGPPDEPALEILFLDEIQAEAHLRQGSGKDQHQRRGQTKMVRRSEEMPPNKRVRAVIIRVG